VNLKVLRTAPQYSTCTTLLIETIIVNLKVTKHSLHQSRSHDTIASPMRSLCIADKRPHIRSCLCMLGTWDQMLGPMHDPFNTCEQFSHHDCSDHMVCSSHQDSARASHARMPCALLRDVRMRHTTDTRCLSALHANPFFFGLAICDPLVMTHGKPDVRALLTTETLQSRTQKKVLEM
jgi:hypothetical protein